MLIIGHRGAAGLATENTLEALRAGVEAGADMLEFDVRLTRDSIAILSHDPLIHGRVISRTTFAELESRGSVTTLDVVLDEFLGKILLNLEYKPIGGVEKFYEQLQRHILQSDDWDNIMVSSFHIRPLTRLRSLSDTINLALLHSVNPFTFVTYHRRLQLSAVGWHRLHVNKLVVEIAHRVGLFSYVYTVNRPEAARLLDQKGVDAVVTDYPNILRNANDL